MTKNDEKLILEKQDLVTKLFECQQSLSKSIKISNRNDIEKNIKLISYYVRLIQEFDAMHQDYCGIIKNDFITEFGNKIKELHYRNIDALSTMKESIYEQTQSTSMGVNASKTYISNMISKF